MTHGQYKELVRIADSLEVIAKLANLLMTPQMVHSSTPPPWTISWPSDIAKTEEVSK